MAPSDTIIYRSGGYARVFKRIWRAHNLWLISACCVMSTASTVANGPSRHFSSMGISTDKSSTLSC